MRDWRTLTGQPSDMLLTCLCCAATICRSNRTEALAPHRTFNPVLQRFYQALQARAMEPDCPLPALDPEIEKYVTPDASLFKAQEARVRAFRSNFELKKNGTLVAPTPCGAPPQLALTPLLVPADKKKTKKRRFWGEQLDEEAGVEETKGASYDWSTTRVPYPAADRHVSVSLSLRSTR